MKLLSPLATSLAAASVATTIFASSSSLLGAAADKDLMWFRQYQTAGDIPDRAFREHRIIRGKVVKVIDGDTIRIRCVLWRWEWAMQGNTDMVLR
jgi:endonuclease YncB( thermonuclease family)